MRVRLKTFLVRSTSTADSQNQLTEDLDRQVNAFLETVECPSTLVGEGVNPIVSLQVSMTHRDYPYLMASLLYHSK